jgi:hypothetical protein
MNREQLYLGGEQNSSEDIEKINPEMMYHGFFIDSDELIQKLEGIERVPLKRRILTPHVTLKFQPEVEDVHEDKFGEPVRIKVVGYGNNGKNEGLEVEVETFDPIFQDLVEKVPVQHITLSLADGALAQDTSGIEFHRLDEQFYIDAVYGATDKNVIATDEEIGEKADESKKVFRTVAQRGRL